MSDDPNSLDLPFEPTDELPMLDQDSAVVCGGLFVRAATTDVPDVGKMPTLVFDFFRADGQKVQPLVLVLPDDQLAKLRPLIFEAIARARRVAKGAND